MIMIFCEMYSHMYKAHSYVYRSCYHNELFINYTPLIMSVCGTDFESNLLLCFSLEPPIYIYIDLYVYNNNSNI